MSAQAVAQETASCIYEIECHTHDVYGESEPEGGRVAPEMFGHAASAYDAGADTQIPRGEDGGVGRAAPFVRGEVDEHGLHGRIHVAVAEAYHQCGGIIAVEVWQGREYKISAHRYQHADRCVVYDLAFAQRAAARQAREDKPAGEDHEECARPRCYVECLLTVYGDVCRNYAEREGEGGHAYAFAPPLEQDEAVERYLALSLYGLAFAALYGGVYYEAGEGYHERHGEQQVEIVYRVVYIQSRRGAYGHGYVVAQTIVSDPFRAAFGMEHVDGHGAACDGSGAEGAAVQRADGGEEHYRSGYEVSGKEQREGEVA